MTGLRTANGINIDHVEKQYGSNFSDDLIKNATSFLECGKLVLRNSQLQVDEQEWFRADSIISDLFVI